MTTEHSAQALETSELTRLIKASVMELANGIHCPDLLGAIDELASRHQPAAAQLAGWKLVPVEPTPEMVKAWDNSGACDFKSGQLEDRPGPNWSKENAALAATIEAMRAIERHGGAVVLERAFTGFTALPAPIVAGMRRNWREVLEFFDSPREITEDDVKARWRRLAGEHHPDRGGSDAKMAEINQARDEALKECAG